MKIFNKADETTYSPIMIIEHAKIDQELTEDTYTVFASLHDLKMYFGEKDGKPGQKACLYKNGRDLYIVYVTEGLSGYERVCRVVVDECNACASIPHAFGPEPWVHGDGEELKTITAILKKK